MSQANLQYRQFIPALRLEWLVGDRLYSVIHHSAMVLIALVVLWWLSDRFLPLATIIPGYEDVPSAIDRVFGALLWFIVVYACLTLLRFFYNYYYFYGLDAILEREIVAEGTVYEVAKLLHQSNEDITAGWARSPFGARVIARLEIDTETVNSFLASARGRVGTEAVLGAAVGQLTLAQLAKRVRLLDESFQAWLTTHGVTDTQFSGAVTWTYREHLERKRKQHWWSKDQLSQVRGIGQEFSYGVAYTLDRFTKPISSGAVYATRGGSTATESYIEEIEQILAQRSDANVLLIGPAGVGKLDLLVEVGRRMQAGKSLGAIAGTHLVLLDTERLLAVLADKVVFEQTFMKLLAETERAGNIVLVIDKLPDFMRNAAQSGIDVATLLDRFLASPHLQVIATADNRSFHKEIATQGGLLRRFMQIQVEAPALPAIMRLITSIASTYEATHRRRFSYAAIEQIVRSADQHIVSGVMPDKAVKLFTEVAESTADTFVSKATVEAYVSQKTGIPIGPITGSERETLLDLEAVLHEQIIGQDAAIDAISGVMRRSRAGIQDTDKPIGSFLFLGPTGVGKTESAKALAKVFFKDEAAMHRFDMSEYSGPDALARLIGDGETPGQFSSVLKEQPYAVVLLDEFEKSTDAVHNLFLQVLDEGLFTDALGQQINARNAIIIATSNAGSDRIIEWVSAGELLPEKKDEIIDHIIQTGKYRPELINRFDDVVLFSPLTETEQAAVARLLLEDLKTRIEAKGYQLNVNDDLIGALVAVGYQPEFGARPMRRAIQEVVEEAIAEKIIAGSLQTGDTITFTHEELKTLVAAQQS